MRSFHESLKNPTKDQGYIDDLYWLVRYWEEKLENNENEHDAIFAVVEILHEKRNKEIYGFAANAEGNETVLQQQK